MQLLTDLRLTGMKSLRKQTPAGPGRVRDAIEPRNPQPQFGSHPHASLCLRDSVRDQIFRRTSFVPLLRSPLRSSVFKAVDIRDQQAVRRALRSRSGNAVAQYGGHNTADVENDSGPRGQQFAEPGSEASSLQALVTIPNS